ncbi:phage portal protein [Streptomyces sp. NBRC 109706]|uniref:phage portal protein n=1 Tax=Streptomyces sp. NBRC 109706 TaxID=1550035 RepID=UPI0007804374|nr:phage portal protein [Streptomyces sp. NBRC 109706]
MGLWQRFKAAAWWGSRPTRSSWARPEFGWQPLDLTHVLGQDPSELWRTQPHLRTVVDFIARNVAQLGLHTHDRVSDTDRRRVTTSPAASLLRRPNPDQTTYELVYATVADMALHDRAFWWVSRDASADTGWVLRQIPTAWVVQGLGGTVFAPGEWVVRPPAATEPIVIPAAQMVTFHGWDPGDPSSGSSPVRALKLILSEQIHAYTYREQVWQRGGRVAAVIERPMDAPAWGSKGKERFRKEWQSSYTGSGPEAGGTAILEDGMKLVKASFSAREDEFVAAATLSLTTVASTYQVNPTMVGVLDNANYSNVREFRRSLYGDSLGPWLTMLQDRINAFLLPMLGEPADHYVEFPVEAKLRGSPEEQAAAFQGAVGRPWMTADEARAKQNMPAIGGDAAELVTPLNVLVGGQASPQDSAPPPDPTADPLPRETSGVVRGKAVKAPIRARPVRADTYEQQYERRLARWFGDFEAAVLAGYGAAKRGPVRVKQVEDYVDREAWQQSLADLLLQLGLATSTAAAEALLEQIGLPPEDYNAEATVAWLTAMAAGVAEGIVGATIAEADEALEDTGRTDDEGQPVPPEERLAGALAAAAGSRVPEIAASQVTAMSGFGQTEAARGAGGEPTKTWRVQSTNPRPAHRRMDGETVPLDDRFSNGARWPADSSLDDAQRAGCKCAVEVAFEF